MPHESAASTSRLRGGSALARRLRGTWRLSRATLHILLGLFIAVTTFGRIDAAARTRRIQWWSARALHLLGVRVEVLGAPRPGAKLLVANHVSWLDIMAINAAVPARFVSKSEVKHWPLLGRLATQSGTLFIERQRPRDALRVVHTMAEALQAGDTLAVFPEGTTSDGRAPLTFHANLLQCAIAVAAPVQPLALRYSDERDAISPAPVYVGDTTLLQSAWSVVCAQGLSVRVNVLPALAVTHADRRRLAERLRAEIEAALAFDADA